MLYQTWKIVLSHIHGELGSGNTKLEITDREIITNIQEQVMPIFSSYSDNIRYYRMSVADIVTESPVVIYKFKDDLEYGISEIKRVIPEALYTSLDFSQINATGSGDITDFLIRQNYSQMSQMVRAETTWKFVRPDELHVIRPAMSYESFNFIVEYGAVHLGPETVDTSLWQEFLDLATASIMVKVGRIRKKFNNVTTPFGQMELNADELINDGKELKRDALDRLNKTPSSDQLVYFL